MMNTPTAQIKTSRRFRKKNKIQDLSTKTSIIPDDEQIATQNLVNVSNYEDNINYQRKFNTTFDMFRSVSFNDQDSKTLNPISNLIKTFRNDQQRIYHPQSLELKKKKRISEVKTDKSSMKKNYTFVSPKSARSLLSRIRKGKINQKASQNDKNPQVFNQLKSNTVFVGKTNHKFSDTNLFSQNYLNQFTKNLLTSNKHRTCHKIKVKNYHKDEIKSYRLFQPKTLYINDQVKSYIQKNSPETKVKTLYEPYIKNQKLERLKKNTFFETCAINDRTQLPLKIERKQQIEAAKNLEFMNNRILGIDRSSDNSFQRQDLTYRRQRK